jgi:predicted nucleic-acid-binding protein
VIGLDANVLIRFLVQDDPAQAAAARAPMAARTAKDPAFVCREALLETVRMPESAYLQPAAAISGAIVGLLEAEEIVVEEPDDALAAAEAYVGGADFADALIAAAARRRGCATLATFDRRAARTEAVTLLKG